jgi:hypothetical protein
MARAIWRHAFEREKDFVVFRRPLTICGQTFAAGEPFDKALVPTRKLRQLFDSHRIIFADVPKPGALPDKIEYEMLIGSSVLASTYEIAGRTVQLGDIVAAAHKLSGMTVGEWNDQPDDNREALLRGELDRLLAEVPGADIVEDAEPLAGDDGKKGAPVDTDLAKLRADYTELTGKKPFGGWKAEELQKRIDKALAG